MGKEENIGLILIAGCSLLLRWETNESFIFTTNSLELIDISIEENLPNAITKFLLMKNNDIWTKGKVVLLSASPTEMDRTPRNFIVKLKEKIMK